MGALYMALTTERMIPNHVSAETLTTGRMIPNHVSAETLTTGRMIPSGTNSPPAEAP